MQGGKREKVLKSPAKSKQKLSAKKKQVKSARPSGKKSIQPGHSEDRYRVLIDNSPVCIHEIDMDGVLVSMNSAGLAMLGVGDESKVTGMAYLEVVCEKDRDRIEKLLSRAYRGHPSQFELTSSGANPRVFNSSFIPIKSKRGKVVRLMGITEDITEQKSLREKLASEEERYRLLWERMPVPYQSLNEEGKFQEVNNAFLEKLGYKREELIGTWFGDLIAPKYKEHFKETFPRFKKRGETKGVQFELRRKDGAYITVEYSGKIGYDPQGKFKQTHCILHDITRRKRAEETIIARANQQKAVSELGLLALSNIELSKLFDKTVNILAQTLGVEYCKVLELLPDGKALLLRSGVGWRDGLVGETIVGAEKESHAGYTLLSDEPVIVDDLRTETRFTGPALLFDHDVVSGMSVIIKSEDKPYGVLGAHTVRRRSFTQDDINFLQSIANILAIAIERKKVEEALREAKEVAEAATKEKDKYISVIAHNLKSPFTSIVTLLELLSSEKEDPAIVKHRTLIDAVRDTSEYAMKVIDDVLRVSRFESGKIKLKPGFMDGNIEAFTVIATHGHLAREKGINLVNEVPRNTRLYADPSLFREVLSNLVYNAIKFCRKGDTITFYVPLGERSTIAIKDTGAGMDECTLSNVFRHDVKTTSLGTAGEKGTGIGLPFCSEIMKAHHGQLTAESVKGGGSFFYAKLPYVKPVALIVDDDAADRHLIRKQIEKIDVHVIEAENEEGVFKALNNDSPHLILIDIHLQNAEGLGILKRLKADSDTRNIPVIIVTSDDQIETREKAVSLGADDFISKPVKPEEFIAKVRKFVV